MKAFSGSQRPRRLTAAVVTASPSSASTSQWRFSYSVERSPTRRQHNPASAHIESLGWDIVGNFGDQFSDLDGGFADKTFKLPNPNYFLP